VLEAKLGQRSGGVSSGMSLSSLYTCSAPGAAVVPALVLRAQAAAEQAAAVLLLRRRQPMAYSVLLRDSTAAEAQLHWMRRQVPNRPFSASSP
jgi:hypothetical protein